VLGPRLRRDFVGFFAGRYGLEPMLLFLALYAAVTSIPDGSLGGYIFGGVCALLALGLHLVVLVLGQDELVAGSRFLPSRWDRREITAAQDGPVPWGRGGPVPGIELALEDGSTVPLPLSSFLRDKRREQWIDEINRWVSGSQTEASGITE